MAGDFFDDLSTWWREGWQAGVNQPSFGPTVGRGLFSNWFLTEREREIRDLERLHTRVAAQHLSSPLYKDDGRIDAAADILIDAFKQTDAEPSVALLRIVHEPLEELLEEEFFWFPGYDDGEIAHLPMETRVTLNNYLLRKQAFYGDFRNRFALGTEALRSLVVDVFDAVAADTEQATDTPHDLTLDLAVSSVIEDVPALVEQMLVRFCRRGDVLVQRELFQSLREQLMRNVCVASGIHPDDPSPSKPYRMPREYRGSPQEVIEMYLEYTPLQAVLESSVPISIPDAVRSEHTLILGGSGHGKSQLLQTLIHHDLENMTETPPSVVVIDSQGDLIHTISRLARFDPSDESSLADRLILVDPSDVEFPVALNLFAFDQARLDSYSRADRERVLNSVIDLFEYFFAELLGAELTQKQGVVFKYLARLMMVIPDATVQTLRQLMEDGRPFKPYMEKLDGSARHFFQKEFFSSGFAATKKQILRRLWGVLANPVFERMFSHPENRIDLFEAMNDGKIILINTAKDHLKAEGCSIFGRFFLAKIAQAAIERATMPEHERRPTFLYVDEAHDYFDETLEQLFNQGRKYRVALHVAAQNLDQFPAKLRATVLASTSLKFAGGVSAKDARALSDDMYTEADFIRSMRKRCGISEFAAYVKNRTTSAMRIQVELGAVNALPTLDDDAFQILVDRNRERYCSALDDVEEMIASYADLPEPAESTSAPAPPPPPTRPAPPPAEVGDGPVRTSPEDLREARKDEIDRYVAGVGGREHTKIQQLVRTLAQDRGFKATIEKAVLDGAGSIDVALERDEVSIAVEVSVSTDIAHERSNVEKGFVAGFDEVVLIVQDAGRRPSYNQAIRQALSEKHKQAFFVFGTGEFEAYLDAKAAELSSSETMVLGYRVTRNLRSVSPERARQRGKAIAQILAGTGTANM